MWNKTEQQNITVEREEVDSTSMEAKRQLKQWSKEGVLLIEARTQTAGYGRKGNVWVSESRKNYYGTFCIRKPQHLQPGLWSLWVGYHLVKMLKKFYAYPESLFVKWPNDMCVFRNGELLKVGGILSEGVGDVLICGIGINLGDAPDISATFKTGVLKASHLSLARDHVLESIRNVCFEIAYDFSGKDMRSQVIEIVSTMKSLPVKWFWLDPSADESPKSVELEDIDPETGAITFLLPDRQKKSYGSLYAEPIA